MSQLRANIDAERLEAHHLQMLRIHPCRFPIHRCLKMRLK